MPTSSTQPIWGQALVLAVRHPSALTAAVRLRVKQAPELMPAAGTPAARILLGAGYGAVAAAVAGCAAVLTAPDAPALTARHLVPALLALVLAVLGTAALTRLMTRRDEMDRLDAAAEARWRAEERDSERSAARLIMRRSNLAVLGLCDPTSVAEIRRAYRGIVMLYHPDLNPGDRSAAELFRAATDARDVLLGRA